MKLSLLVLAMVNTGSHLVTDDITRESIGIAQMIIFISIFFIFCSWSYDKTDKACLLVLYSNVMYFG